MWWLIIILTLAGFLAVVAYSKIRLRGTYQKQGKDDFFSFSATALFGLLRYEYKVPMVALKPKLQGIRIRVSEAQSKDPEKEWSADEIRTIISNAEVLIHYMKQYRKWLSESFQHVHIDAFRWKLQFGLGDAPQTGIASGMLWGVMSSFISVASRWVTFDARPDLQLIPVYQDSPFFRTDVSIRANIRVYRLFMIAGMMLWRVFRRRGGWKIWYKILIRKKTVNSPTA